MKLPIVSGKDVIKALSKIGYYIRDQKGSHVHLRHPLSKAINSSHSSRDSKRNFKSHYKRSRFNNKRVFKSFIAHSE